MLQGSLVCPPAVDLKQTWGSGSIDSINPSGLQGDPVNSLTGNLSTEITDLSLPGIGIPFAFTRSYNSADTSAGPLGVGWTHSYNTSLLIDTSGNVTIRSENGQQTIFEKEPDGSFVGAPGALSRLKSTTEGYELTRHDDSVYRFNAAGKPTAYLDENGHGLTFSHDASGNLGTIKDDAGRVISLTYDASGLLTKVALPDGRSVAYGYTNGLLTSVTDTRGGTTTYAYDTSSLVTKIIDQNGQTVVSNAYGADGRVTEQTDALGNKSTFSWDETTQTATMTDARDNEWKDVYDNGVLAKRIDPLGNTTTYERDAHLDLITVTDPRGNTTTMTYDASHNMLTRTAPAPLSYKESFTYDSDNNLISETDGRGNTTTFDYDAKGNLIRETRPGGIITEYGRDPATGLLVSITDPRGKTTRFDYDPAGNLITTTSPLGFVATMTYDSSGRMTLRVEPRGNEPGANPDDYRTFLEYDAANHLVRATDPLGNTTASSYDPVGSMTSRTDAKGRVTNYAYDAMNRLKSVTAPDGTTTSYTYDAVGNLVSRTDAKNHTTAYAYDQANRLMSVTSPTNQLWTYSYDAAGNRANTVDASGTATADPGDGTTAYSYDELNRLVAIDYSDATPDVAYAYDSNGNRVSMADAFGTETYGYDALDRLTSVGRGDQAFAYDYDAASNLTTRTYPDGTVVAYAYDDDSRLASVTSGTATTGYSYDASGNLTKTTLPSTNGHAETRVYDRAGRLVEVKNANALATLSSFAYELDAVGNPLAVTTGDGKTTYSYDALDRLTSVCFPPGCTGVLDPDFIKYTYDPVANRTSEERATGLTTYDYNAADQLVSKNGPDGAITYDHDANGNLTRAGPRTFAYDLVNRMVATTKDQKAITYSYDGDGKRLRASAGDAAADKVNYLWDPNAGLPLLVTENDGTGALLRRYAYGKDLISMTAGSSESYYHYDGLGSVTNVTSAAGTPQWSYTYEPFGSSRTALKVDPLAPDNPMRFTGEYLDPTGLYHLRARQYDVGVGRFMSIDPIESYDGLPFVSTYAYVRNNPVAWVDPSGKETNGICASGVAGALLGGFIQGCVTWDRVGWPNVMLSRGPGSHSPAVGFSVQFQQTDAATNCELAGNYGQVGGSVGLVNADYINGAAQGDADYDGWEAGFGASWPGVEVHVDEGHTTLFEGQDSKNIFARIAGTVAPGAGLLVRALPGLPRICSGS